MNKLDSCQHRSADQVHYGPPCCSNRHLGYYCTLRGIHGITNEVCDACEFYLSKVEEAKSEEVDEGNG